MNLQAKLHGTITIYNPKPENTAVQTKSLSFRAICESSIKLDTAMKKPTAVIEGLYIYKPAESLHESDP